MIKLIFEGIEDNITLEEFKENYNFTSDEYLKNIVLVEDDGEGNVIIKYFDNIKRYFHKYPTSDFCELIREENKNNIDNFIFDRKELMLIYKAILSKIDYLREILKQDFTYDEAEYKRNKEEYEKYIGIRNKIRNIK